MSSSYPVAVAETIEILKSLPGVGKRSAERMALEILKWDDVKLTAFADLMANLHSRVGICSVCGNLADYTDQNTLCPICASPDRDVTTICVVEDSAQIRAIENSNVFRGVYHVLCGRIAPLEGKNIDSLTIPLLEKRLDENIIREVILALSPDVEGQATAAYLSDRLKDRNIRISSPARGLPAGSDLTYVDGATLAAAWSGRIFFKK